VQSARRQTHRGLSNDTQIFIAAALALAAALPAAPAQAASRTFVSAAGNDSNPCTITLPCRNLQAAYNAVAANGQIDALDPGNYGALAITGPVSIEGHGWAAMSAATGTAITINAQATDKIAINGVVLDGLGIANTAGIRFSSGGNLTLRDSVIRNFTNIGLSFGPSNSSQLFVSNTLISDNSGYGIALGASGSVTVGGNFNHVEIEDNELGLLIDTEPGQTLNVTVSDTIIAKNGVSGFNSPGLLCQSAGSPGGTASVVVRESTIAHNNQGLQSAWSGCTISVTRSTIAENGIGLSLNGGQIVSYMDNNVINNGINGNPSSTIGYQ
jgi:hypothetical protein